MRTLRKDSAPRIVDLFSAHAQSLLPRSRGLRPESEEKEESARADRGGLMVKPNSQNARILRVLADGKWKTTAAIHRKAGTSRLNSRISELRKYGYEIEHGKVLGKAGPLGHRYRLINPPAQTELARLVDLDASPGLPRDEVPRNEEHRFRIYRMIYDELDLVATASTPEDVGVALITLGREGEFEHSCAGVLDTHGTDEVQGAWILNPFDTSPS